MDYTFLAGAAGAVGGAALTLATNFVNRRWQINDKAREQAAARAEVSRKELLSAYIAFFGALSKFIHSGDRLLGIFRVSTDEIVEDIAFAEPATTTGRLRIGSRQYEATYECRN